MMNHDLVMMELDDGFIRSSLTYWEEVLDDTMHVVHIIEGELSSFGEMKRKLAFI